MGFLLLIFVSHKLTSGYTFALQDFYMKILLAIALLFLVPASGYASLESALMSEPTHIEVNNRILADVNGTPISVYDLMKKMDVLFYKQYPQYASSVEARFQYYKVSWKNVFYELVDKELIMLDAREINLPVSSGDIRQDIESIFGPNIHANLDKLGMTFTEAEGIIKDDITIRRMLQARVGMKAQRYVTPITIKQAYETFAKQNLIPPEFTYTVITVRDPSEAKAEGAAKEALRLLREENISQDMLEASIITSGLLGLKGKISISKEMHHTDKEMNESYKEILSGMNPGTYSEPVAQVSKDKTKVYRIFQLKEKKAGGEIPFKDVEGKLKDQLMAAAYQKETEEYLQKMREHFHVNIKEIEEALPADFEPFALK